MLFDARDGVAFLIGSSVVVSIITTAYVGAGFVGHGRPPSVPIEWATVIESVVYGLAVVLLKKTVIDRDASWLWAFAVGALTGLLLSLLGHYAFHLPSKIFGYQKNGGAAWHVHLIAPVLYALIFGVWVYPIVSWALRHSS